MTRKIEDSVDVVALLEKDSTTNTVAILKLFNGTFDKAGTTLARKECQALWEILIGQRKVLPRGRKPNPDIDVRDKAIAGFVASHMAHGRPTKVAIANAVDFYGVSRTCVYEALKKHPLD